jgi:hypothetical protein
MKKEKRQFKIPDSFRRFFIFSFLFLTLFLPSVAAAHDIGIPYWGGKDNPILACTGNPLDENDKRPPCKNLCDVFHTFQHAIYFGITLVLFALAPIMFLAGGIMVVLGGANPNVISTGKNILWSTVIGVAVALGSFVIIATFLWLVGNKKVGGVAWPQIKCENPPGYEVNPEVFKRGYSPASPPDFSTPTKRCNRICPPDQECRWIGNVQACVRKGGSLPPQTCDPLKPAGQQGCPPGKSCVVNMATGEFTCQ